VIVCRVLSQWTRGLTEGEDVTEDHRREGRDGITRRHFTQRAIVGGAALTSLPAFIAACGGDDSESESDSLIVVSYGGSYGKAYDETIIKPFEADSGIEVSLLGNTSLQQVKLQVTSGNVEWDLPELSGAEFQTAKAQDLVEPYDYDEVDASKVPEDAKDDYGIRISLFMFVMAWDERQIPNDRAPQTWAEFFDTSTYPGKRSLYDNLTDGSLLEAAAVADGVPLDEVYPLDVDRAIGFLEDSLGPENIIFHNSNEVPVQQLTSGEVPLATSYNGRIRLAREQEKAPINFTPQQSFIGGDYFVVPKGAPHIDAAWNFLTFMFTNDQAGAEFTTVTGYPISNSGIEPLLSPEVARALPTNPALEGETAFKDDKWWADNLEQATDTFKEWQLSLQ
jgi:putative spermidine/putrescine transport system substrate-binding protein